MSHGIQNIHCDVQEYIGDHGILQWSWCESIKRMRILNRYLYQKDGAPSNIMYLLHYTWNREGGINSMLTLPLQINNKHLIELFRHVLQSH